MRWKTILAPTDFSEHSRIGLDMARDLARESGARMVVLHVIVDALPALLPDVVGFRFDEVEDQLGQRAREALPTFFSPADREGLEVEFKVAHGVPHAEICRLAAELPADLIVIGTHGRSAALQLLIGSVAEKVVRKAPCPVLVARRPPVIASE